MDKTYKYIYIPHVNTVKKVINELQKTKIIFTFNYAFVLFIFYFLQNIHRTLFVKEIYVSEQNEILIKVACKIEVILLCSYELCTTKRTFLQREKLSLV